MQRIPVLHDAQPSSDEFRLTRDALICYNPDSHSCHRCGKQVWASRRAGTYRRGITFVRDGQRVDEEIMIPVCLCERCGKSGVRGGSPDGDYSHAILPDILIPFTYFTLLFVLTVLQDYANRYSPEASRRTVAEICSYWDISVSTLYRWKKRYMEHYDAWADSLESISRFKADSQKADPEEAEAYAVGRSLKQVFCSLFPRPSGFFRIFLFSFLQPNRLTHFRPLAAKRRL